MKISCGIVPYRIVNKKLEVFLVHPGGPFFKNKTKGFWGISKGEIEKGEEYIDCALREFKEETGVDLYSRKHELKPLGSIVQKNNKMVYGWAIEYIADIIPVSNTITINLGFKKFEVPEIDQGKFFSIDDALVVIREEQRELILSVSNQSID